LVLAASVRYRGQSLANLDFGIDLVHRHHRLVGSRGCGGQGARRRASRFVRRQYDPGGFFDGTEGSRFWPGDLSGPSRIEGLVSQRHGVGTK
jgi:hypothetical protein